MVSLRGVSPTSWAQVGWGGRWPSGQLCWCCKHLRLHVLRVEALAQVQLSRSCAWMIFQGVRGWAWEAEGAHTRMQAAQGGSILWEVVPKCTHVDSRLHVCVTMSERLRITIFGSGRLCVGVERILCDLVSLPLGD